MERRVSVSLGSVLLAGVMVLVAVAAYLIGASGGGARPAFAAEGEDGRPTITMTGAGTATAVPDQVSFNLRVSLVRADLDTALADANDTMRSAMGSLADYDVADSDIQTTGLTMRTEYDYSDNGPPRIIGYRVTEKAHVTVERFGKAGAAIGAAVKAGGNDVAVSGIRLEVSDPEAALAEARKAAVAEATAKAEQYAEAAGQGLGGVVSLVEVTPVTYEEPYAETSADRATSQTVPVRAGESDLRVTVRVVWEIT